MLQLLLRGLEDIERGGLKTSFDTAKVSTKPMVASHSGVAALNPHKQPRQVRLCLMGVEDIRLGPTAGFHAITVD